MGTDTPPMYPFQEAGALFLAFAKKAMLLDSMGTGKTRQTIETLKLIWTMGDNPFPAIVVCPNNMTLTWKKEFERWWPGVECVVIGHEEGKKTKLGAVGRRKQIESPAHVKIINYESVRSHSRLAPYGSIRLRRCEVCDPTLVGMKGYTQARCEHCKKELNQITWKTVIVDEAHRLKEPKTKQTRSCWALRTDETEQVFALTGTAIANAPHDLYGALHLISPKEFPSRVKYIDRYTLTSFNIFGGMQVLGLREDTKKEFFDIVDPRMRRMPKEAVLPHLPKKTYSERYVAMPKKQGDAYRQMEQGLIAQVGEGLAVAMNPLVQLTRLTQFASANAEITDEGEIRLAEPSNKIDALMDLLNDMGDDPLVVFAQSRQLIELAAKRLEKADISYELIVGGQTAEERERAKDNFQSGRVRVILCTIAAGGIGITLTRAATACFLQRSWSMVDNSQAEDRVHRIGSEIHDKVEIIDIISIGTLEERQRTMLGQKADRLEEVMRDKETLLRLLGEENS